jgi:hypothetical protein
VTGRKGKLFLDTGSSPIYGMQEANDNDLWVNGYAKRETVEQLASQIEQAVVLLRDLLPRLEHQEAAVVGREQLEAALRALGEVP